MLTRIRGHLTYANVMATAAVFIALGGVSYAAVKLPKGSVGTAQLKQNAVTGPKIKSSSVTGSDVRNGSLSGADVQDGSLSQADFVGAFPAGAPGSKGDPGPQGLQGLQGGAGPPGPTYAEVENRDDPPGSPDGILVEPAATTVTTPAAGRLLVMFTTDAFQATCTSGISTLGLYVDGTPVPDTLREFPVAVPARPVSVFGVTATAVAAGAHVLTVRRDCPTGDPSGTVIGQNNNLGAVLLGG